MSVRTHALLALITLALSACGGGGGGGGGNDAQGSATMRPGEDCKSCHSAFTAAGTVYLAADAAANAGVSGASVVIVGTLASLELTTNAAGNFYTTQAYGFPATVTVTAPGQAAQSMVLEDARYSGCGSCHGAGGRVHSP